MANEYEAFFERDGDRFVPTGQARGPWNPDSMHGRVLAGLLAHTVEREFGDPDFHFARLTIDLFRLPPLAPVSIVCRLIREGNRIKVAEGSISCEGVEVARGTVVMLKHSDQPEGAVWSPPDWDVPAPDAVEPAPGWGQGRMAIWDTRSITGPAFGGVQQKRAWLRENRPLIGGEALTPFVRAAVAADYTNPFANSGERGLNFVNADITLYLHRLPQTQWIGFEVASHHSAHGIAVAQCTLYDERGAIGKSVVCAVANQRAPGAWPGGAPRQRPD